MTQFLTYIGDDIDVCVDYDATYQPASVACTMDHAYPEYGEMTINSVTTKDGADVTLNDEQQDRIEQEAWDHYHSRGVDGE